MKKILFIVFLLISFGLTTKKANALSFAEAPTINDYVSVRGSTNLYRVLFGLTFLYFSGSQATSWDELEAIGERGTADSTFDQIASFIADHTFEVQLTKFGFGLIMAQLLREYPVVEKNYFDSAGYYIPLSQQTALGRGGIYIDFANLFNANTIYVTSAPLANGYEYRNNDLWVNRMDITIDSPRFASVANDLFIEIVNSPDRHSGVSFNTTTITGSIVTLETVGAGVTRAANFGRIDVDIRTSLASLNSVLGMDVSIRVGDMTKTLKGLLNKEIPLEKLNYGQVLKVNPTAVLDRDNTGTIDWADVNDVVTEKPDTDTEVGDDTSSIIKQIVAFLEKLFIPDFTGVNKKMNDLRELMSKKFGPIFDFVNAFRSIFSGGKSLHDLRLNIFDRTFIPFPKETLEQPFIIMRNLLNGFIVLFTLIRCYKRVVGEGDLIE